MSEVHNRTKWTLEQLRDQELYFNVRNEWRMRNVEVRKHPELPDTRVVSIGITFDGKTIIVCDERREAWAYEFEMLEHRKRVGMLTAPTFTQK